jgi:hypothetical protein
MVPLQFFQLVEVPSEPRCRIVGASVNTVPARVEGFQIGPRITNGAAPALDGGVGVVDLIQQAGASGSVEIAQVVRRVVV